MVLRKQKSMELPAQVGQTPRDGHTACNAKGGQKGLLSEVFCGEKVVGNHRVHAIVEGAAGDQGDGGRDEKWRGRCIAEPGKNLGVECRTKPGQQIGEKNTAQGVFRQKICEPCQKPTHCGSGQITPVQIEHQPRAALSSCEKICIMPSLPSAR